MKYRRIPYFSPKVHFYAKQTTQLPSDISKTSKTHLNHQNPEFSKPKRTPHLSNLHTSTIHSDKTCGVRYLGLGGRKIDDWKKRWEEEEEDIGRGGEGREGKEEQKSIV